MTRRLWLHCVAWSLGWLASFGLTRTSTADQQQATLNEMLRSQLKCRRPEEFAYVEMISNKVNAGELPLALVLSMMKWSRKRSAEEMEAHRRKVDIPFPYFQQGMKLRAAEIGVNLPAFSVNISQ
jgi:hypothetical protein